MWIAPPTPVTMSSISRLRGSRRRPKSTCKSPTSSQVAIVSFLNGSQPFAEMKRTLSTKPATIAPMESRALSSRFFRVNSVMPAAESSGRNKMSQGSASNFMKGDGNIEHRTSNIEHPTSNFEHRTSNIEHRTSNIEHPTSNIEHPTSNIEHPTSNIEHRTTNNRQPTTDNQHHTWLEPDLTCASPPGSARGANRGSPVEPS